MRRVVSLVLFVSVSVLALEPVPALAQAVITAPPLGQVDQVAIAPGVPTSAELFCSISVSGPVHDEGEIVLDGDIGPGTVAIARCYGTPVTDDLTGDLTDNSVIGFQRDDGIPGGIASGYDLCSLAGESNPAQGRFSLVCVANESRSIQTLDPTIGTLIGVPIRAGYVSIELEREGGGFVFRGTPSSSSDSRVWARPLFWQEQSTVPPWPRWWPSGAITAAPVDASGELPRLTCTVRQERDLDGTVRARVRATVNNPAPGVVDLDPRWQFEFDNPSAPIPDNATSTTAFWDAVPTYYGWEVLDVVVPQGDIPDRGWIMRFSSVRQYQGDVYGVEVPSPLVATPVPKVGGQIYIGVTPYVAAVLQAIGGTNNSLPTWIDDAASRGELVAYNVDSAADEGVLFEYPTAYVQAAVRCSTMALPPERGREDTTGIDPTRPDPRDPTGPANPTGPTVPPDGPSGSDCGGLSWNPLTTFENLACNIGDVLGPMFRWLGELIEGLLDHLSDLFTLLRRWLIPESLDVDWESLKASFSTSFPGGATEAMIGQLQEVQAIFDPPDSGCVVIAAPGGNEICQPPVDANLPGAPLARALMSIALVLGVFVRVIRTAPWSKGRDGAEPFG
jgi:hypothetical protein